MLLLLVTVSALMASEYFRGSICILSFWERESNLDGSGLREYQ